MILLSYLVLFLLQTITDKVIESVAGIDTHTLYHLWIQFSLKTDNSLSICVNHVRSITTQVVESMQILIHDLGALIQREKFSQLHFHQIEKIFKEHRMYNFQTS
jgi:hypothetical protein